MDFSLTSEQREIQALAREFADAEIAPHAAQPGIASTPSRGRSFAQARRARPDGRLRARGARRARSRLPLLHPRARGALARRRRRRRHRRRAHERGDAADPRLRHRRAAASAFVPALARGEMLGAFALTEADSGSDAGALRTTAVPDGDGWRLDRRQAVDHERQLTPARSSSSRAPTSRRPARAASPRSCSTARGRGDARGGEARPQLVVDRRPPPRRRPVGADRLLHEENRGFSRRDGDARRRSHRDRRAGGRDRAGGVRRRAGLRARARAVRQPHRRVPGDPVQARRHGDRDRRGATAHLPRGLAASSRGCRTRSRARRRSCSRRRSRVGRRARRSRSSAATATRRSSRSSATTATRRSPRSTRARARSSASSSRARSSGSGRRSSAPAGVRVGSGHAPRRRRAGSADPDLHAWRRRAARRRSVTARVSRSSILRIAAFGTVDELNALLGVVLAGGCPDELDGRSRGSRTSSSTSVPTSACRFEVEGRLRVEQAMVDELEADCDRVQRVAARAAELRAARRHRRRPPGCTSRERSAAAPSERRSLGRGRARRQPARRRLPEPALRPALHPRARGERARGRGRAALEAGRVEGAVPLESGCRSRPAGEAASGSVPAGAPARSSASPFASG